MQRFFLELLNRAICAGWLVPVILLVRLVLKKMPKWMRCLLWGMVAVRLIVPIQIESDVSLIPGVQTVSPDVMYAKEPEIHTGIGVLDTTVNPAFSGHFAPEPENSVNPVQVLITVAAWVWLSGALLLFFYAALSYVRLRLHVRTAVPVFAGMKGTAKAEAAGAIGEERRTAASYRTRSGCRSIPILESERVGSPFVLGLFRPRIYLPAGVREEDRAYIVSHEMAHIHRKDHWIKPFGYLLSAVYWFHPLLWAAYILLCRDIEYACDERMVKRYDVEERKAYSTALLTCSACHFRIAACPVAFGEVGVRQRVKGVLHYKKPAFWVLLAAAVCCAVVAVCFLTNPKTGADIHADGKGDGTSEADGMNGADMWNTDGTGNSASEAGGMNSGDGMLDADGTGGSASDGNGTNGADVAAAAVPAEGAYEFARLIYLNPLSSYFPLYENGQLNGYLDADGFTWNEYGRTSHFSFEKTNALTNTDSVAWRMFEAEEFEEMIRILPDNLETGMGALYELPAEKRLWRPLEGGYWLLYVDGELWLMQYTGEETGVWSIYALRPQEENALDKAVTEAMWSWAEQIRAFGSASASDVSAENVTGERKAVYPCVSYAVLATEGTVDAATGREKTVTVYAHVLATAYLCENTGLTELGRSHVPAAITFLIGEDGSYTLSEYWTPGEGSYYVPDIREKFPKEAADAALDWQQYGTALIQKCYAEAVRETGVVDTWSVVRGLFQKMMDDPEGLLDETADAADRMAAYPLAERELVYYGENTLRYLYHRFMSGGENGLEGELMARVMDLIIADEIKLRMPLTDGQAYFDELCVCVQDAYEDLVRSQGGEKAAELFMREHMPAQYLLFSMLEQRTCDADAG
ncbi:MAG: M56 family metallopeptidase [bacterium]|nr:M56 family metallopeptidase [bacterium]